MDIVLERLEREPKLSEGDVSWGKGLDDEIEIEMVLVIQENVLLEKKGL
jgi:hypothetical protein